MKADDTPAAVAKVIVPAATDKKPKLRYTAGPPARRPAGPPASRATTARCLAPAGTFDKQIRENARLLACHPGPTPRAFMPPDLPMYLTSPMSPVSSNVHCSATC
ncbi:hypothetical protein [Streptomyces canus]|uniref:hypothetical protein n=1 Tax=Streptomyces canus TaxID=58343 RepID=UPI002E34C773|nr:hypothetical protein [Streptomyces canus]